MYERESPRLRAAENRARGGRHAYERGLMNMTRALGVKLDNGQIRKWGWRFHKGFGWSGGLTYLALRRRYPKLGLGWGLAFGTAFFLLVDELMMPLFGWTPGPRAFSWKVHARGAASHLAYGVTAETVARLLERERDRQLQLR